MQGGPSQHKSQFDRAGKPPPQGSIVLVLVLVLGVRSSEFVPRDASHGATSTITSTAALSTTTSTRSRYEHDDEENEYGSEGLGEDWQTAKSLSVAETLTIDRKHLSLTGLAVRSC